MVAGILDADVAIRNQGQNGPIVTQDRVTVLTHPGHFEPLCPSAHEVAADLDGDPDGQDMPYLIERDAHRAECLAQRAQPQPTGAAHLVVQREGVADTAFVVVVVYRSLVVVMNGRARKAC